jgi:hypothetical protein
MSALTKTACAFGLVAVLGTAAARADDATDATQAIWKTQQIQFNYFGFTSTYTCDGLRDRVRAILQQVGADKDMQVSTFGCGAMDRPTRLPSLKIVVSTPVPATPENLAAVSKQAEDQPSDKKTSRKHPLRVDTTDQFPAVWRTVDFRKSNVQARSGECELMEQLRDQVFKKLSVRIVEDHLNCIPNQISIGQPDFKVAALVPAPKDGVTKE